MGSKLDELAAAAKKQADELDLAKTILLRIVVAKRSGEADLAAWAMAFQLADQWLEESPDDRLVPTTRCPECMAVLAYPDNVTEKVLRVDCGSVHVLHFASLKIVLGEGSVPMALYYEKQDTVIASHEPVFGVGGAKE